MDPLLISMPDIAELADVQRPVVTTWRRRYPDFPPPVATDTNVPLFVARDVADWLTRTNRVTAPDLDTDLALYGLARYTDRIGGERLVAALTALLCLRHLDGRPLRPGAATGSLSRLRRRARAADPDDLLLASEIGELGDDAAFLVEHAELLVEAAWDVRRAFRHVLRCRHRLAADATTRDDVLGELARLVAGLSGAADRAATGTVRLVDLAAGSGDLVSAVLADLDELADTRIRAAETDRATARLLRRRLAMAGLPPRAVVDRPTGPVADALGLEDDPPDVVLHRLPYRPGESRAARRALTALADTADLLPTGATAVLLGPAAALTEPLPAYGPAWRLRADLLRAGNVEAVIRLPGGCLPYRPAHRLALWVLRRERDNRDADQVLTADLSDRALGARDVDEIVTDVVTWRRDGYPRQARAFALAVPVRTATLLARDTELTAVHRPHRLTDAPAEAQAIELEAELNRPAPPAPVHLLLAPRPSADRPAVTTLGALIRQHAVLVRPGTRLRAEDTAVRDGHPVFGAPELTSRRVSGHRRIDRAVFAARYDHAALTQPGDVVVTVKPELAVLVDTDGYAVVEFPARVLRIAPEEDRFTPSTLAALLSAAHSGDRPAGAVHEPLRLDQYPLPLLPPAETARLDAALRTVQDRRRQAREELAALDELTHLAAGALLAGSHTIGADTAPR
ncbi:type II restriction endonuclease subunit M [Actinocatenispora thailandica]|uniref:Type II restriction endonuclease subunit M n=1 Tax=Actinocatenispora thailandica TaxID=227318 RepID=A0A7R7DSS7_9ACTN|nr:hypothetical protein [Actinocatenispora thailandica]BCJ37153.1 type II restriction endonuclease subunit M [Actinocatenispora thailandica]